MISWVIDYFKKREKAHIEKQMLKIRSIFPCTWCGSLQHKTYAEQLECCRNHYAHQGNENGWINNL